MSKFEVIEGGGSKKVSSLTEIRELDHTVKKLEPSLTYKGLYVYAYHYARLGATRRAVELLNKIPANYYMGGLFKDLYRALFCWTVHITVQKRQELYKEAEFFVVVKRSLPLFKNLDFVGKNQFIKFYQHYCDMVKFTNAH